MKLKFTFIFSFGALLLAFSPLLGAQETPYFVTYSHHLEQPNHLEIEFLPSLGTAPGGQQYLSSVLELEYGVRGFWTSEVYLDGQSTFGDSALVNGFRLENRFRLLMGEHRVNPVLYLEYENLNGADKARLEVVGFDRPSDYAERNAVLALERVHELEGKLILSSNAGGINFSENFIVERKLQSAPFELGYALAASRPFSLPARPDPCSLCPENFSGGIEVYGGLGTNRNPSLSRSSHYVGPLLAWSLPNGLTFRVSPTFAIRGGSAFQLRFGVGYEVPDLSGSLHALFHGSRP